MSPLWYGRRRNAIFNRRYSGAAGKYGLSLPRSGSAGASNRCRGIRLRRFRTTLCVFSSQNRFMCSTGAAEAVSPFWIEVETEERHVMLKAAFPVAVRSPRATCEIQFGAVERPTHRNASWAQEKFEVFGRHWADLSEPGSVVEVPHAAVDAGCIYRRRFGDRGRRGPRRPGSSRVGPN